MLPGTKVLSGKALFAQIRNPGSFVDGAGGSGAFDDLHVDKVEYTPKVDETGYASSATSGYMGRTSGIYECEGTIDVLVDIAGSLAGGAATGIGMAIDDFVDLKVFTTNNHATPQFAAMIHIQSISKPIATTDNKIKLSVKFATHLKWTEA